MQLHESQMLCKKRSSMSMEWPATSHGNTNLKRGVLVNSPCSHCGGLNDVSILQEVAMKSAADEETRRPTNYAGKDFRSLRRKATACKACTEVHDPEGYAAFETTPRTCTHHNNGKVSAHLRDLGRKATTACTVSCSNLYDPERYAAHFSSRRCI